MNKAKRKETLMAENGLEKKVASEGLFDEKSGYQPVASYPRPSGTPQPPQRPVFKPAAKPAKKD